MKLKTVILLLSSIALLAFEPKFMRDPAISPDGSEICFEYKNDLWKVPFDGGEAKRLTSVPGSVSAPAYSPDGKFIAFNSGREGYNAVYVMPSNGGKAKKVVSGNYTVVDWFNDSEHILLTRPVSFTGNKLFKVKTDGSGLTDLNAIGFVFADLDKENRRAVFSHLGDPHRISMKGSRNGSIHLYDLETDSYKKIYDGKYTERYPVFSKTGKGIYFTRSDGEHFQICLMPETEIGKDDPEITQLTQFDTWSARDISIARENDRITFEFFDALWTLDPETAKYGKVEIEIKEDMFGSDTQNDLKASATDLFAPSAKGDWAAFKYKYDLFAVPYEGGELKRLTQDSEGIGDVVVAEDNHTVFFTSLREGNYRLFRTSVKSDKEPEMIKWSADKIIEGIALSSNRLLIYYSDENSVRMLAVKDAQKDDFVTVEGSKYVIDAEISSDGNYVFYSVLEPGLYNRDIYIFNIKTGEKEVILSYMGWLWNLKLDPDEEFVFYNKDNTVYRADLKKLTEFHFEKDKWKDILEKKDKNKAKEEKKEKKEPDFVKSDLSEKETAIISWPGVNYIIGFAKDQTIYYINEFEEKYFLRKTDYQAEKDEVISELAGGEINNISFNDSTSSVFYLQGGKIKSFNIASKKSTETPFSVNYTYDRQSVYPKVFNQIHSVFARWFYDPNMHGVDWNKLKKKYSQYLKIKMWADPFSAVIDEMIGELNASHTGYYASREPEVKNMPIAGIGAEFDYTSRLERGIKLKKVYLNSILGTVHGIKAGDILISVDGTEITSATDIDSLFVNKVDEKIRLVIRSGKKDGEIFIKGLGSEYMLVYDTWTEERRLLVDSLSGGRIGYAHIRGMSEGPLNDFIQDLFIRNFDKEAVVIDVRYNGGGYTHDQLIEILTKKHYAYTTLRWDGAEKKKSPHDIWDKPSVLLINRSSFSDAEIFPQLYRDLGIGKIIGTPTNGDVIGTGSYTLIDGSSMRMPRVGWYRLDHTNMEGNGVEPDIFIDPTFSQLVKNEDPELRKAVEVLLSELDN
ncbi:MAG: PD40 domain-containing protein [Candidatus Delongbacteria bacterium]|nr:PD40 domain-containing protein [Candidatus Delongbacteria bacterium]